MRRDERIALTDAAEIYEREDGEDAFPAGWVAGADFARSEAAAKNARLRAALEAQREADWHRERSCCWGTMCYEGARRVVHALSLRTAALAAAGTSAAVGERE